MGEALVAVGSRLDHKFAEIEALSEVTGRMNCAYPVVTHTHYM